MAKDPAFLFYSSDFLTGVSDLTMEERGQYITLLCLQHQKGRLSKKMVLIAAPDATADVLAKFKIDDDGMYYNVRLEFESNKRAEHAEKQRQRAIEGWKKRKAADNTTADAAALPLENENEIEIENVIPTIKEVKEYFIKNGYSEKIAIKAFEYYNAGLKPRQKYWRDSNDNPIKNWKQKMRGVWFKDENKELPVETGTVRKTTIAF